MPRTSRPIVRGIVALAFLVGASGALGQGAAARVDAKRLAGFEQAVDELHKRLRIPGLSAIVVKDQAVLWSKGFGFADLAQRVPATPDTLYSIASVTKPIAATLVLQLVEAGKLDLDAPVSRYSDQFKDDAVRVRHLITHTSSGTPGERFEYDGGRYDALTAVLEKTTGKTYVELLVDRILDPLAMASSLPYHGIVADSGKWIASLGNARLDRYARALDRFARPYAYYGAGETVDAPYPPEDYVGAAAGILSTVRDLAAFDVAIDRHALLAPSTQQIAWTPAVSNAGQRLPYGLGWFVTDHHGHRLVWHYGQWGSGYSALYVKVPERRVTLVVLANSEALAGHGYDDVASNGFVCSFLSLWGIAGGCEARARAAIAKWIDERRASGLVAVRVDPAILETYVGRYRFEALDNRVFTISREGGRLFSSASGSKRELFAETPTRFFLKIRPYKFVFSRSAGEPARLEIVEDGTVFRSTRIE
jgi:CubicO group peptidase (beta-lactamase class C family)